MSNGTADIHPPLSVCLVFLSLTVSKFCSIAFDLSYSIKQNRIFKETARFDITDPRDYCHD